MVLGFVGFIVLFLGLGMVFKLFLLLCFWGEKSCCGWGVEGIGWVMLVVMDDLVIELVLVWFGEGFGEVVFKILESDLLWVILG